MSTHEYPYSPDEFPQRPTGYPPPPSYPPPGYSPPPGYPPAAGYPPSPGWPPAVDAYGRALSDRSRVTAGLLGIFFGPLGLGRFYLGYTGVGIGQIAATWLTCGIGGLWPLIDAILILTGRVPDAEGRVLRD
jgi:TM2 domain-containing membrane protein YozV